MPAKNARSESGGFSAGERAAMKERAAELRAEGKQGARKADGLQAVLDSIAQMVPEDRVLAERVHVTVTATAPERLGNPAQHPAAGPGLPRNIAGPSTSPRRLCRMRAGPPRSCRRRSLRNRQRAARPPARNRRPAAARIRRSGSLLGMHYSISRYFSAKLWLVNDRE